MSEGKILGRGEREGEVRCEWLGLSKWVRGRGRVRGRVRLDGGDWVGLRERREGKGLSERGISEG